MNSLIAGYFRPLGLGSLSESLTEVLCGFIEYVRAEFSEPNIFDCLSDKPVFIQYLFSGLYQFKGCKTQFVIELINELWECEIERTGFEDMQEGGPLWDDLHGDKELSEYASEKDYPYFNRLKTIYNKHEIDSSDIYGDLVYAAQDFSF